MPRKILTLYAAAAFALLLAAPPADALDQIRLGNPAGDDFHFAMANIGTRAGIFAQNGIELKISALLGGAKLHQAMVAGSLDIALGAGTDFNLLLKGAPEKGVGVLATKPSNMVLVAATSSRITALEQMKGKKIGVSSFGALTYWLGQQFSKRQGWGLDGVKLVATGGQQGTVAGFVSGDLDGAVTSYESSLRLARAGRAKTLLNFGDIIDPFIAHVIYATDTFIAQHPDELRRFLKAWYESVAWAKTHKAETIQYSQPETLLPDDLASEVYDVEMPTFSTDGRFDAVGVAAVEQALIDMGQIKTKPDDGTLFTEKFLP